MNAVSEMPAPLAYPRGAQTAGKIETPSEKETSNELAKT
jgi:hypothetical protein